MYPKLIRENLHQQVEPYSKGDGGVFQASAVPLIGVSGIVGYITEKPDLWFTFLASDPDMSVQDNCSLVGLSPTQVDTNNDTYNEIWKKSASATIGVSGGSVKVTLLSLIILLGVIV